MSERYKRHLKRSADERRRELVSSAEPTRGDSRERSTARGGRRPLGSPTRSGARREFAKRPDREGKREEKREEKRGDKRARKGTRDKRDTQGKQDKQGKQGKQGKRGRRGKQAQESSRERSFSVWRAVSLFPTPSRAAIISSLIYSACLLYVINLIPDIYDQLQLNVNSEGIKRTFYARQRVSVPLPKDAEPVEGQLLDRREIELWPELARRAQLNLKSTPPLIKHKDPLENYRAWLSALEDRRVYVIEGVGPGDATMISLIWPPAPAPQPTLVIGQAFDQIAWIDPELGVILSPVPEQWREARALRIQRPIGVR